MKRLIYGVGAAMQGIDGIARNSTRARRRMVPIPADRVDFVGVPVAERPMDQAAL
jgi:hypothetical protein